MLCDSFASYTNPRRFKFRAKLPAFGADTKALVATQAPCLPALVFGWLLDAYRSAADQTLQQCQKRQERQASLLLPCRLTDCCRRSCHRRCGPVDKQLRERLQQHSPEDRPGALRLHLAPTSHRLPEARQRNEVQERVVPDALAAGHRDLRRGRRQRLHRPAHVPGSDGAERAAVDRAPQRGGRGHGVRVPLPGQVELRGAAGGRSCPAGRRAERRIHHVPGERSQGGHRGALAYLLPSSRSPNHISLADKRSTRW